MLLTRHLTAGRLDGPIRARQVGGTVPLREPGATVETAKQVTSSQSGILV